MKSGDIHLLRRHALRHVSVLRIRSEFLRKRFVANCSMGNCNGTCCKNGVLLDVKERDRILSHAGMVGKYMEPGMEADSAKWFGEVNEDMDFPSGACVATGVRDSGCVFLDSSGRCVLQKAAEAEGMPRYALKPFFCVTYPVTMEDGEIILDDPDFTNRKECCSTVENGSLTVVEVCPVELEFMLGGEGFEELQQLVKEASGRTAEDSSRT